MFLSDVGHNSKEYVLHKKQCTSPKEHYIHSEAWYWQHHAFGLFFWTGALVKVEGIMNSSKYQHILAQIFQASARKLKKEELQISAWWQTKAHIQSTKWRHQNMIKVLEWPCHSPDLNIISNLWLDLKRAMQKKCPWNWTDLEQFC